jgi:BlaI family penicillinase repressor
MKRLTAKEEEVMNFFWDKGPLFVKEIIDFYEEPKPHFNTISTFVRDLESRGYLGHEAHGKTYRYFPLVTREEFSKRTLKGVIENYFDKSYLSAVSALVKEEDISVEDLKKLIEQIENSEKGKATSN